MTDHISAYVDTLAGALHGPRHVRIGMLTEVRDGLTDAAEAHRAGGLPPAQAAARAVRDFGSVGDIAPLLQDELAVRQSRRTALLAAVMFPGLTLGWGLLWSSGVSWKAPAPIVRWLAMAQDVQSIALGVAAVAVLLLTFHRTAPPRMITTVVGLVASVGVLTSGAITVLMNTADLSATTGLIAASPVALLAYTASAAVFVLVLHSSVRTLRVLRRR